MRPNPTDAKTIALHFLKLTHGKLAPLMVQKTITQVKRLQTMGYTTEDILYTVDTILDRKSDVFSFGYISKSIDDILRERDEQIEKETQRKIAQAIRHDIENSTKTMQSEVSGDNGSTKRNREKASRIGIQSGLRKKSYFDLFEEQ